MDILKSLGIGLAVMLPLAAVVFLLVTISVKWPAVMGSLVIIALLLGIAMLIGNVILTEYRYNND